MLRKFRISKNVLLFSWISLILFSVGLYFLRPQLFTSEKLASFFHNFEGYILVIYIFICMFRGFTLIPSTPFVIAGTILFPDKPVAIFIISLVGILSSSSIIYYFSGYFSFDKYFEKKFPGKIKAIETKLNKKSGFFFISLWYFIPASPSDLIGYVAGTVKMNFKKFISAVFVGSVPFLAMYVFFGSGLVKLISELI